MAFSPALSDLSFLGGVVLGLGASLHCAGMCGAIGSSLVFTLAPGGSAASRARVLMTAQAGRVAAYVFAGSLLGGLGSGLYGLFDQSAGFRMLQWAAALALGWTGLSIAGLAPPLSLFDRAFTPVAGLLARAPQPAGIGGLAPLASGLVWGLLPCAIVYGALLAAMLTGSAGGGALLMLGFGLGTLPAVTASAFGLTSLTRLARSDATRRAVGLGIAGAGVLGLLLTTPGSPLCII